MADLMEPAASQSPAPARETKTIADLPPELVVKTLEHLPDVASLRNAAFSHRVFYNTFSNYRNSLVKSVLKNEVPDETYTHAIVAYKLSSRQDALPSFEFTDINRIAAHVDKARRYRDDALTTPVSLTDALAISRMAKKVTELCHILIEDCAYAKEQRFVALWESIRVRPPSPSEMVRIQQAIYLFQIVAHLCCNWFFMCEENREYLVDCQDKLTELQICIVQQLMAPWELYQVIAVQAYFRRALHGLTKQRHLSERIMPGLLAKGIDVIHNILHVAGWKRVDEVMEPLDRRALRRPPHALGMVLSRGVKDTWTRKQPRPYDDYRPFWGGDYLGYESWAILEKAQLKYFRVDEVWDDFFHEDLRVLEGRLDLWSAALWNESRWEEISATLDDANGDCWKDTEHHWDPIVTGLQVAMYPAYFLEGAYLA